jgi:hypothetical protein
VGYAVVFASIFALVARLLQETIKRRLVHLSDRMLFLVATIPLLFLMVSHWGEWIRGKTSDEAFFSKVSQVANEGHLEVVCKSHWDAFYLATRTPTERVAYVLDENFPFKKFLLQNAKYYPRPRPIPGPDQLQITNEYLFLSNSPREARIVNPTKESGLWIELIFMTGLSPTCAIWHTYRCSTVPNLSLLAHMQLPFSRMPLSGTG